MKCSHCSIAFHDNWIENDVKRNGASVFENESPESGAWILRTAHCPGCKKHTIQINRRIILSGQKLLEWRQIYPVGSNRGPVPMEVPTEIAEDYIEACSVMPLSIKASAALSRRCLQNILHANGYKAKDLAKEIGLILNEADPKKALPARLRETIDGIRNFGNFAAHPVNDKTALQIINVEPHEAEWCLEMIEELFDHFYVGPAIAKARKAALDAKLASAGKPPSKS
jgi:hypothetical protein